MNVLIVEDEPNYADTLEMRVIKLGYKVIGIAGSGKHARLLFRSGQPDLVLMDIHLEGNDSGIDLAKEFQATRPTPIIFITSFNDKNTFQKAKETGPYAYLTKPFDPDFLERSIELALMNAHASGDEHVFDNETTALLASDCFFVKDKKRLTKVKMEDILWIEVEDKYCLLVTAQRKYILRRPLREVAAKLDRSVFVQTHRSYVVNSNHIDDIDYRAFTLIVGGQEIPLGKSHKEELIRRVQTF